MPISIPPFTPTALQPNSAETFATYVKGQPAAKIPLSGTELFPILQNGFIVQAPAASLIGTITVGGSTIFGSTNQAILFDKAGVVGEDTNLEWDYTNHILNLGPNARLNSIGTTWRFDVGGTTVLDYGITNSGAWTAPAGTIFAYYHKAVAPSGFFPGLFAALAGDSQQRAFFGLDGNDRAIIGWGPGGGTVADVNLYRYGTGILGLSNNQINFGPSTPCTFQVYNIIDLPGNPTNYERGVFDWTTTSNYLTIGTQKGGTGSLRAIEFVGGPDGAAGVFYWLSGATFIAEMRNDGNFFFFSANAAINVSNAGIDFAALYVNGGFPGPWVNNQGCFVWGDGTNWWNGTHNTFMQRTAAGVIGLGMATGVPTGTVSPAGFQVYNTFDNLTPGSLTNYERGVFDWTTTANVLTIGTQKGGTGSTRNIRFVVGNAAVGDYGITSATWFLNFINTNGVFAQGASGGFPGFFAGINGEAHSRVNLFLDGSNNPLITFNAGVTGDDLAISRAAAGVIAFGGGTNADASATIKAKTKAGAPTASDVPAGTWVLIRDTTNATTKLYYNNAGTLQTVALV